MRLERWAGPRAGPGVPGDAGVRGVGIQPVINAASLFSLRSPVLFTNILQSDFCSDAHRRPKDARPLYTLSRSLPGVAIGVYGRSGLRIHYVSSSWPGRSLCDRQFPGINPVAP